MIEYIMRMLLYLYLRRYLGSKVINKLKSEEEHERGTDAGANRREKSGRRKKAAGANEDTKVDGDYRGSGFTFERYRELVTRGVHELSDRIERGQVKYRAANAVCEGLKPY